MTIKISDYKELDLKAAPVQNAGDSNTYSVSVRKDKKVLLYNNKMELLKVLNLEDYETTRKTKRKGSEKQHIQLNMAKELIAVWSEDTGLSCMKFDGTKVFSYEGAYSEVHSDFRNEVLWAVLRNNNENITVQVIDYAGDILASLPMEDPLYQSMFGFTNLPEKNSVAISFGGGQDGSQDYFLEWKKDHIEIVKTLPDDLTFIYCDSTGKLAMLFDFYEGIFYKTEYPGLKEISHFIMEENEELEEYCAGSIIQVNNEKAIICNEYNQRYYLFDIKNMELSEEITFKGYEPKEDKDGEICSDISTMSIKDGKLFAYLKNKVLYCDISVIE